MDESDSYRPEAAIWDAVGADPTMCDDSRWPEPETVSDWSQGVPLAYLRDLCGYWAEGYDWRATEARLNGLPQCRTEIGGLMIHFIHARSPHPGALPLSAVAFA